MLAQAEWSHIGRASCHYCNKVDLVYYSQRAIVQGLDENSVINVHGSAGAATQYHTDELGLDKICFFSSLFCFSFVLNICTHFPFQCTHFAFYHTILLLTLV